MKRYLPLLFVLLMGCTTTKAPDKGYGNAVVTKVLRVCDGDTFVANIQGYPPLIGENIRIRIRGINTPELNSPNPVERQKAIDAKKKLTDLLKNANQIELRNITRGKYFRIVADIYIENKRVLSGKPCQQRCQD